MLQIKDRRDFLKGTLSMATLLYFRDAFATALALGKTSANEITDYVLKNSSENPAHFFHIFNDPGLKDQFYLFLKNVYNIYPEGDFHRLIEKLTAENKSDEKIYKAILLNLKSIKPLFSEISYALPALTRQKSEIARQTMEFLKDRKSINGYLEIGTPGRYINELKSRIELRGEVALVNITPPSYSPMDIVERGQLTKLGRYIPLNDYESISVDHAADTSFEVVTNYIGLHHSSLDRLDGFVRSIQRIIKPGGTFILRDHDVDSENMNHMVALAHDVFNAGLRVPWEFNHQEVRNFRSLSQWIDFLKDRGFNYKGQQILQAGDPTKNALMEFQRI